MASQYVEETIGEYLAGNWTLCPILTENLQGQAPEDGSPFLVLQFPLSETTRLSTGTRRYREEGGIRLLIHVERGGGVVKLREWGDTLGDLFRDQTIGGIHCLVPSEPFAGDQEESDAHWSASMVVPYWWTHES